MTATVYCFQHCERNTNILCFQVPATCPLCGLSTEKSESRIPPFEIKSPLSDAAKKPFSVVIKPTNQQFLDGYRDGDNLHIGVTSSTGLVFEYDEDGVSTKSTDWMSCVAVPMLSGASPSLSHNLWDSQLKGFASQSEWSSDRYNESTHNCFDFVLGFLQTVPLEGLSPLNTTSKARFCEHLVRTHTVNLGKYLTLYKQIQDCGVVCIPVDR